MRKINIYDVDRDYTEYLQRKEIEAKGYTAVPNMDYEDRERYRKFFAGPVVIVDNQKYFVPASHKTIMNDDTHAIYFSDEPGTIKGTLRFQYMIPVPDSAVEWRDLRKETEHSRKAFMFKYLRALETQEHEIKNKAKIVYDKQVNHEIPGYLEQHFNDFKFLESKMIQYELNRRLGFLNTDRELDVKYKNETQEMFVDYGKMGDYKRIIEPDHLIQMNYLAHIVDKDLDDIEYLNTLDIDQIIMDEGLDFDN